MAQPLALADTWGWQVTLVGSTQAWEGDLPKPLSSAASGLCPYIVPLGSPDTPDAGPGRCLWDVLRASHTLEITDYPQHSSPQFGGPQASWAPVSLAWSHPTLHPTHRQWL